MKNYFLQMSVILFSFSLATQAEARVSCKPGAFLSPPKMVNGLFVGLVKSSCEISEVANGNVSPLHDYYKRKVKEDMQRIHHGPHSIVQESIPVSVWDADLKTSRGKLRANITMGDDGERTFVFNSHSVEVHFEGVAEPVKKLNVDLRVEKLSSPASDRFLLTVATLIEVTQASFTTENLFLFAMSKLSMSHFNSCLKNTALEIEQNLR